MRLITPLTALRKATSDIWGMQDFNYHLPKDLKIGDKIRIYPAGAYTTAYQTDFNGIKKIKQIFLD